MAQRVRIIPVSLLLVLLGACDAAPDVTADGAPGAPDGGSAAALSPLEYQLRLDDLWCHRYAECSGRGSYEACKSSLRIDQRFDRTPLVTQQVAAGRVLFHEDRAAACLERVASGSCAAVVGYEWADWIDPVCFTVFEPAQGQGEACDDFNTTAMRHECTAGLTCQQVSCDENECCEGVCATPTSPTPPRGGEGSPCSVDRDCAVQLACNGEKCTVPRAFGDHCSFYCAGDNVCRNGTCVGPEVAAGITTCDGGTSDTTICSAKDYCGNNGKCYAFAGPGEPCGDGVGVCDWYFECNPDSKTCQAKQPTGSPCARDTQCLGARSSCTNGTCTEPLAQGFVCDENRDCLSEYCEASVCVTPSLCDHPEDDGWLVPRR